MGLFVIEGPDLSGKTTVSKLVVEKLQKKGIPAIYTREPGGTGLAEKIRELLIEEEVPSGTAIFLFEAARFDHFEKFVVPKLGSGLNVISDRMSLSTYAYQVVMGGVPKELVDSIDKWARHDIDPKIYFYLSADTKTLLEHGRSRGENVELGELEELINAYEKAIKFFDNVVRIDVSAGSERASDKIVEIIEREVRRQ